MKRPTLRDIAAIAGVSHVAVSMALRGHPRIPAATRERIKQIAEQIGYRPDPALASLNVYRHEARKSSYKATLAWVNFHEVPLKEQSFNYLMFLGAQERCAELGYSIEEFQITKLGMNISQLSKILYARNVQGVFFAPLSRPMGHVSTKAFAWDHFSVISLGFSLVNPKLDVVIDAQYRAARLAVRKLKSLGYRRIGFATCLWYNERTDGNVLAGYLSEQIRFPEENRIPPFIFEAGDVVQQFREWFYRYKPDSVFDANTYIYGILTPEELSRCGVAMHGSDRDERIAGIDQNVPLIGRVAANEIVGMINANVRGIPAIPRRILVEGTWVDGPSAPRVGYQ